MAIKVKCGNCGKEVELIKHVNKCECGARIKVLKR
jgi:DNA-directed RNA polymerase subunit RPC12/RpoP